MGRTIDDLREALFETMEAVKNGSMEIDRAKTVAELGQTIINTAKVEVQYLASNNGGPSKFIETGKGDDIPGLPDKSGDPLMSIVTRRHRIGT